MSKRFKLMLEEYQGEEEDFVPTPEETADVMPDEFGGGEDMPEGEMGMGEEEETEEDVLFDKMADFINALDEEDVPEDFKDSFNEIKAALEDYERSEEDEEMPEDEMGMDDGMEDEEMPEEDEEGKKE